MAFRLLVILGAGASYDCTSPTLPDRNNELRPPLVTELFEPRSSFTPILREYPLAQSAAQSIRPAIADGSVALERFLRERLRDSEHEHDRRSYAAIPLYLQHLLFQISQWPFGFTGHPNNYDALVRAALRADEVTFVTLNYDDILDRRLFMYDPLVSMESYLGRARHHARHWSLIKLHGSVNWARVVNHELVFLPDDPYLANTFATLGEQLNLSDQIELRLAAGLREKRAADTGRGLYYPALSAPLGSEDELVCPPEHLMHLRERLGHWDELDVLVIGYSGLDQEVCKLLGASGRLIRSLWIVNKTEDAGTKAARSLRSHVKLLPPSAGGTGGNVWDMGFDDFVSGGHLDKLIETLRYEANHRPDPV